MVDVRPSLGLDSSPQAAASRTNRRNRLSALLLVLLMAYAGSGLSLYRHFGHSFIAAVYRGDAGPFNGLIESQDSRPLSEYLAKADRLFIAAHSLVAWLGACVVLQMRYRLVSVPAAWGGLSLWVAVAALAVPFGLAKILLLIVSLAFALSNRSWYLEQGRTRIALFCLFGFAFLVAPYWSVAESTVNRIAIASVLVVAGLIWSRVASAGVNVRLKGHPWTYFAVGLALLGLEALALMSEPAAYSDEMYHFAAVLEVLNNPAWLVPAAIALLSVLFARRDRFGFVLAALTAGFLVAGRLSVDEPTVLFRYPFLTRWFQALPSQLWFLSPQVLRDEASFRVVPFVSALLIAWAAVASGPAESVWRRTLRGVAVGTTPLLVYHGSMLYMELPAALLMLFVCLDAGQLLNAEDPRQIGALSWLGLMGIGFIKETSIPFLSALLICRFCIQVARSPRCRTIVREIAIAAVITTPLMIYVAFNWYVGARGYGFQFSNLTSLPLFSRLIGSWFRHGGLLPVLAGAGLLISMRRRRWPEVAFYTTAVVLTALFHLCDNAFYVGYSRFNIFLFPPAIVLAIIFLDRVAARSRAVATGLWFALFVTNLLLYPLHLDGSRQGEDTTYPYSRAVRWLKDTHPNAHVVHMGMYDVDFYFRKFGWRPTVSILSPALLDRPQDLFEMLRDEPETVLIYHGSQYSQALIDKFPVEQKFSNAGNSVLVLRPVSR